MDTPKPPDTASRFISQAEYVQALRPLLPAEAFAPAPRKLWLVAIHLVIIGGGYAAIRFSPSPLLYPVFTLIIGHSLGCLAFLAHELSHNAIVRHRALKRTLELLLWGLNLLPPTLWHRIHNQTHHLHPNALGDTDRSFVEAESSQWARWYTRLFVPNKKTFRWLPTVFFNFVTYIVRYTATAFYPADSKPVITTAKPAFIRGDRLRIVFELLFILALQAGVLFAVGWSWAAYLWAGPFAFLTASTVVMAYIFTNHFLNPLCEVNDPLMATTSVSVPRLMNQIHSNFSYHTEHHVFPCMNSNYYPLVSELLKDRYVGRYHQLPFAEAWRRLWQREEFLDLNNSEPRSKTQPKQIEKITSEFTTP